MDAQSTKSLRRWIKNLPHSRVPYPATVWNRVKYGLWRAYTPVHPFFRDSATVLGVARHSGRTKYLLGKIVPGVSFQEMISHLVSQGFGNHFIAWRDEGEIVSLRYVENQTHQYHIRIFIDREIRGHYEFTPETKPLCHLREDGIEPRREMFLNLLRNWIIEAEE